MARLERAASTSQMSRATNCTTPGYLVVMIIARKSCDLKFFPVCGQSCGQSRFYAAFGNRGKSRKRRRRKALRRFDLPRPGYRHGTPKAGALPTALHPEIPSYYNIAQSLVSCNHFLHPSPFPRIPPESLPWNGGLWYDSEVNVLRRN